MAEEASTADAAKQFEDACEECLEAEQEANDLQLALFQARKKVQEKREAKKKASDLLDSLVSRPPSSEQIGAARADARAIVAVASGEKTATNPDIEIEVDVTIVEKEFLVENDETKLFLGVVVDAHEDGYRVLYEDGDDGNIDAEEIYELVKTDLSAEEAAAVRAKVAKYRQQKRAATSAAVTPSPPKKKRKKKKSGRNAGSSTSSTPRPRKLNLNSENEWENDMLHWLLNVPHGSSKKKKKTCSQANAQQVIRRARQLLSGKGITYKNWPEGVMFAKDESITLEDTNFDTLHDRAKAFEEKYGKDKGNGWLLQHPIHKMKLYQEYRSDEGSDI
mmetsp:Transcript_2729/g.8014  ORF Transcript_2729/g.8014 Transcript_2729/m.8014 type:complete len:334 (-) Transcript_2729:2292-3293(-)